MQTNLRGKHRKPHSKKAYPRMVTSTTEEIAAHNKGLTTRQVRRHRWGQFWKSNLQLGQSL